jgi:hypothetical protein
MTVTVLTSALASSDGVPQLKTEASLGRPRMHGGSARIAYWEAGIASSTEAQEVDARLIGGTERVSRYLSGVKLTTKTGATLCA